ncbi:MAG: hypothetical protein HOV79_02795, partial [Hamadaea sp.]|nr:hypothetical protein [Hamadaea sp.]
MTDVAATPFATLLHAYGRAEDTPAHLAALADGDDAARAAAVQHLWSAIIHQGTPWTATPATALVVAALIGDRRLAGPDDAGLRATLLRFLAAVAEAGQAWDDLDELVPDPAVETALDEALRSADEDEDEDGIYADEALGNALYARAIRGCREVTPTLLETATSSLSDPDPVVRAAAAYAAGVCCAAVRDPGRTALVAQRLAALTDDAGPDERATVVLAMGDLGAAPRAYLTDP